MSSLNYVEPPNSNLVSFCHYRHRSCADSYLDLLYLPVSTTRNDGAHIPTSTCTSAPFVNPTTTRSCMHTFCHDCVVEAVKHSPHCPIDRSAVSLEDLAPANPIVKHVRLTLLLYTAFPYSNCCACTARGRTHCRVSSAERRLSAHMPAAVVRVSREGRMSICHGTMF